VITGLWGAKSLPFPGPWPCRAVHRVLRRRPSRRGHPGREDHAPNPGERSRRTVCSPPALRSPTLCWSSASAIFDGPIAAGQVRS